MNMKTGEMSRLGTLVPVIIRSRDKKQKPGQVYVQSWNKKQRLERALKILGMGWGLAVLSVFLPIAHFILVPGFLLGAPLCAFWAHRQYSRVLGGEGLCPHCGEVLPLVKGPEKWPLEDLCALCENAVVIEKAGPAVGSGVGVAESA